MNPGTPELGSGPPAPMPASVAAGAPHGSWGRVGPSRGTGREACQPSQQALLGWRDRLWIWFSQNTKPPTWSLSPRHWGLCQACAHPLRLCQGGGWAGRMDTVGPVGLSGRGPVLLLKPSPASISGTELLRLRGDLAPWKSCVRGRSPSPRAPHHWSPERISMMQCSRFVPALSKLGLSGILNKKSLLS